MPSKVMVTMRTPFFSKASGMIDKISAIFPLPDRRKKWPAKLLTSPQLTHYCVLSLFVTI